MWFPYTPEEKSRWLRVQALQLQFEELDRRCFRLESQATRFSRKWREHGSTHELRMEHLQILHEIEMLKIDIAAFERRLPPPGKTGTKDKTLV